MADPNTRQGKRTPVTLKIKFKSETLEQFIERYAVDVSQGGIFIRTKEPLAVGTQMKFEFQLRDASPLIAGEGTVVWTRENDPSRPAIAPGMGVRFDRLADGSQTVLEKILAEKAKQAPSRSNSVTAPGESKPMFTDVPTKVAPAPVQDALGLRSRGDSEQTPLPKPMPFHSDADDFDEKAFEEATKVRSLDELAAASALDGDGAEDDGAGLEDNPKHSTVVMPADELAVRRRVTAERDVPSDPVLDAPAASDSSPKKAVPDRDSAPALPSVPAVAPRLSPPPPELPAAPPPVEPARTRPDVEQPKTLTSDSPSTASATEPRPRSVTSEPARPTAPSRPSSAPIVLFLLLAVVAAGGAVWYFVLRDDGSKAKVAEPKQPDTSATKPERDNAIKPDNGSAGSDVAVKPDIGSADSGSAGSAGTMAGSNAGSAAVSPQVDTVIAASLPKGATVEIVGTDQKGPAPFTAKLEKDKVYKAHVTAPGYLPLDIDVKGGEKTTAKLTFKPHILSVTSDPPGADIYIDGVNTQKIAPADITLTPAQAAKPRVRLTLRRAGHRPSDQMVEASAFADGGSSATAKVSVKLQVQQQVVRPPSTGGSSTGSGAGSAGGTSGGTEGGGAGGGGGGESGSAAAPPPPPAPAPAPAPSGSASPPTQILK